MFILIIIINQCAITNYPTTYKNMSYVSYLKNAH